MRDGLFTAVVWGVAVLLTLAFACLLGDVVSQGASKLSWRFFTENPARSGREGGIYSIIVSTLLILSVAVVVALPLGLSSGIWLAEFTAKGSRLAGGVRLLLDVLAGVPSIVFGLFGYAFFCRFLDMGFSILAGGLTLACMMLPILVRTTEAGLSAVSDDWRQGGAALGFSRVTLLWQVLLPYAAPSVTAGLLLAIGRATAETAALIFTSGYVDRVPESLHDSGRALSVHIYDLSMNVMGGDAAAYGSAFVLIALIIVINIVANGLSEFWLARRVNRY